MSSFVCDTVICAFIRNNQLNVLINIKRVRLMASDLQHEVMEIDLKHCQMPKI